MKSRSFFAVAILCCLFSCKNADEFEDKIYFAGTDESVVKKFSVDRAPLSYPVSIAASCLVQQDMNVSVEYDPSLVEAYNQSYGTKFKPMPDSSFALDRNSTVIAKGKAVSDEINVTVTSIDRFEEAAVYLVPLTITNSDGLPVLNANKTIYLQVSTPIITPVANFDKKYFKVDQFQTNDNLKALNAFTYETRIKGNKFMASSPFISSVMGIEEVAMLRFGDTTIEPNQLQLAGFGPLTSKTSFSTGVWYHIAVTYDGAQICLYVDGNLDASVSKSGTVDLTKTNPANPNKEGFRLGFSAGGRTIDAAFSETRVWSVARTKDELRNNKCYVDPSTPGLVAYWRFNEGSGTEVKDYSPNGYNIKGSASFTWTDGISCEF